MVPALRSLRRLVPASIGVQRMQAYCPSSCLATLRAAALTALRVLDLTDNPLLQPGALNATVAMPALEWLSLSNTNLAGECCAESPAGRHEARHDQAHASAWLGPPR